MVTLQAHHKTPSLHLRAPSKLLNFPVVLYTQLLEQRHPIILHLPCGIHVLPGIGIQLSIDHSFSRRRGFAEAVDNEGLEHSLEFLNSSSGDGCKVCGFVGSVGSDLVDREVRYVMSEEGVQLAVFKDGDDFGYEHVDVLVVFVVR